MALVEYYRGVNPPENPVCSVCIAHYRNPGLLADCLDSLLLQDCNFSYEIIVHDDASGDASLAMLSKKYPQVEVLASNENVGFCIANNRMVARARGKYVLLLNNDAALFADALSTLASHAERIQSGILTLPQYDWDSGETVDRGCLLDPFYNPVPNLNPARQEVGMVIGACLWIEKARWEELGGFPEWLESVGEDLYLCCAARLAGIQVQAINKSGYRHRQGHSFGGNKPTEGRLVSSYHRRRLSERNKTFVLFVMTPTVLMWPLLGLHIFLLLVEGIVLSMIRLDVRPGVEIYWNVPVSTVSHWSKLLHQRNAFQQKRRASIPSYIQSFILLPRKLSMLLRYGIPGFKE